MGVYAGPKIPDQDNIIFYIDGKNINSFPNNGKIKSLVTQEEKDTSSTQQNGYIYSNNGYIDKFTNISIQNSSAITVNFSVDNTELKSGTIFSFWNDDVGYKVSGITSYCSGIVTTVSSATTSHSLNLNVSGITSYCSGIVTTVSSATTSHSLNLNVSGITSYCSGIVTTNSYEIYQYNPFFELSCKLSSSNILVVNKNIDTQTYLLEKLYNQEKDIYTIIFKSVGISTSDIVLYRNGRLLSSSQIKTKLYPFQNVGISLFGSNNLFYSQYGIRLISVYNKELNDQEVLLINNLNTN